MTKVLIVDDEESILALLSSIVGSLPDCVVVQARDAQGGLQAAREGKPDIMLLDNRMPGMSGLEACRLIKSDPDLKHIKILMLSCQGQNFDWLKAQQFGADGFFTKPFDTMVLIKKVKEMMKS